MYQLITDKQKVKVRSLGLIVLINEHESIYYTDELTGILMAHCTQQCALLYDGSPPAAGILTYVQLGPAGNGNFEKMRPCPQNGMYSHS